MEVNMSAAALSPETVLTPDALLTHWQGHRGLTRRVIDAFPDDKLFSFSIGGMRTFGMMAMELLSIGPPMVQGIVTGEWPQRSEDAACPKAEVLRRWDEGTALIDRLWPQIPAGRFQETMTAFGQYPGQVHGLLLYAIDNEIHHRGEGYVYLRALGIEPPAFYDRY
jgi:uncharacterized damage-inducible protein DinB